MGLDAGAVVADDDAQLARGVAGFRLRSLAGLRNATQGVEYCFAGDQVDLVEDGGVDWFRAAHLSYDSQAGAVGGRELVLKIGEGLFESCGRDFGGAEVLRAAALGLRRFPFASGCARGSSSGFRRENSGGSQPSATCSCMEALEESLQQRVVEFAWGDADAFAASFFLEKKLFASRIGADRGLRNSRGFAGPMGGMPAVVSRVPCSFLHGGFVPAIAWVLGNRAGILPRRGRRGLGRIWSDLYVACSVFGGPECVISGRMTTSRAGT